MKHWLILTSIFIFLNLSAQENFITFKILKQLNLSEHNCMMSLIVSKVIPNNPEESIYVIPEIVKGDVTFFELNSHILIVNSKTGEIKNKYFESSKTNEWYSDAIRLDKITIDTARYYITDNIRAFGIRIFYYGSSKPNPYSNETISLFIKSKDSLKKILNNYDVMDYGGEWDTNCFGEFIKKTKTLSILSKKSNSYYDILVNNKITETKNFEDSNGNCQQKEKTSSKKTVLKFNGNRYKESVL